MIETLITSKTRIKLMLKFFLNSSSSGYLRGLETEFGESTNAIRQELNRFEAAGLLKTSSINNRKIFKANKKHPLYADINSLVRKYIGIDEVIERIINHLGDPKEVYLIGDLAMGINSSELSMVIVGENIDLDYLETLTAKAQNIISRKIRYLVLNTIEFEQQYPHFDQEKLLPLWKNMEA